MTSTTSTPVTNWSELPSDLMANILHRVGVIDILENVQKVCTTWHKICKDPVMWRVIYMDGFLYQDLNGISGLRLGQICKLAVKRSHGQLVDLTIVGFGNDELLQYVADRSSQLRGLEIAYCVNNIDWNEALKKLPLLEELNLYTTEISKEAIETAGRYCSKLKTLKVNQKWSWQADPVEEVIMADNEFARTIGENLFNIKHLELIGSSMTDVGLRVILDGCCHLESLDLRHCLNFLFNEDIQKRCSQQIKHLKLPDEDSFGFLTNIYKYNYASVVLGLAMRWYY